MDINLVKKYAPNIYFDKKEPFFPARIGCTIFEKPGMSPSFRREILFDDEVQFVIEYAIYWDFDIQHLYELEHVWVYVDKNGEVYDCEASFHGKYLRGLLKDRSNIEEGTHVRLYSQPGKHAFSPMVTFFELIPGVEKSTYENAGDAGLVLTGVAKGRYSTNEEINEMVHTYLQKFRFRPSMEFQKYTLEEELFVDWDVLDEEIPVRIYKKLEEIKKAV